MTQISHFIKMEINIAADVSPYANTVMMSASKNKVQKKEQFVK